MPTPSPSTGPNRPSRRRRSPWRLVAVRPRMATAVAVALGLAVALPSVAALNWAAALLVAWNFGAGLWLVMVLTMMAASDETTTIGRARRLDEGAETILALSAVAATASLVAIVWELSIAKDFTGTARGLHIGLAAVTVLVSWAFIHVMFAQHYAHVWFLARDAGSDPGLRIPGDERPDYWDFLYVAVVIGTSGQTADVEFTSKRMRRIGLAHCALAFVFNTTVLALTVNIAAGLI